MPPGVEEKQAGQAGGFSLVPCDAVGTQELHPAAVGCEMQTHRSPCHIEVSGDSRVDEVTREGVERCRPYGVSDRTLGPPPLVLPSKEISVFVFLFPPFLGVDSTVPYMLLREQFQGTAT